MPGLVSTPYRLYYLINNDFVRGGNHKAKVVWRSRRTDDLLKDEEVDLLLETEFDDPNDFYSLRVRPYHDIATVYYSAKPSERRTEKLDSMPWDDLDQDIIDAISEVYEHMDQTNENYYRIVSYADFVQQFAEHPEEVISVSLGEDHLPRIEIDGLMRIDRPGISMGVKVEPNDTSNDFVFTINSGEDVSKFTYGELKEYERKSSNYDGVCRLINDAINGK